MSGKYSGVAENESDSLDEEFAVLQSSLHMSVKNQIFNLFFSMQKIIKHLLNMKQKTMLKKFQ